APLVLLALDRLELIASVVDQTADRRARPRGHLDEVESFLACDAQSGVERDHSQLVVLVIDQPHFRAADLIVDLQLFKRDETLPRPNSVFLVLLQADKQNGQQKPSVIPYPFERCPEGEGRALLQVLDGTGNVTPCAKLR